MAKEGERWQCRLEWGGLYVRCMDECPGISSNCVDNVTHELPWFVEEWYLGLRLQ